MPWHSSAPARAPVGGSSLSGRGLPFLWGIGVGLSAWSAYQSQPPGGLVFLQPVVRHVEMDHHSRNASMM